jgi:type VI secretion system secreted protein Hcp
MAESIALYLKANGADIKGESTITSQEREGTIECTYFEDSVRTAREKGSGMATGRRTYEPLTIRKSIDSASPLIAKALCNNEVMEGTFKFFRPNPADGITQHFFTVQIFEGRVASIKRVSMDTSDPALADRPPQEEVAFVFHTIRWCFEPGGVEHQDSWREQS